MLSRNIYIFNDPGFSEYVFQCLRMMPKEKFKNLTVNESKWFRDESAMRRFAENETLEKRLYVLARLGHSYCVIVGPSNAQYDPVFAEIDTQYHYAVKRKAIVELMAAEKIFALSSRDVLLQAHMAAQNSHSQIYLLDPMYLAIRDKMGPVKESQTRNKDSKEALSFFDEMSHVIMNTLSAASIIESIGGVSDYEMRILLALFRYRNTYVTHERIGQLIHEPTRSKGVGRSCAYLVSSGHISRLPGFKGKHLHQKYTIMETGITAVMDYINFIIKKSL